jgi:hypoxanthine phosphoribosyltransferase
MEGFLNPSIRDKRIKGALKNIKLRNERGDVFDAIAYRGASGAITASIIAYKLKKPLILVRKPEDNKGHSPYSVEGPKVVKRYLIVDDFMSSGSTYEAIRNAIRVEHPQAVCIGMLEVAYAANETHDVPYRYSNDHSDEIERDTRLAVGKATRKDVEWVTREEPIAPTVIYKPVTILKDKDEYRFDFENNRQKLLVADTTPKRGLEDIFIEFLKKLNNDIQQAKTGDENIFDQSFGVPREEGVDGMDIYNTINPFSRYFYNPIKYRVKYQGKLGQVIPLGAHDKKAQKNTEAAVPAAAEK